ncbi:MAG: alpha/beta hydrolase [Halieaceae bacterium]|jgi:alpha-beta hydrolase superfamily lysophospholipase|nr:alpha/beta hydrolase [Halieaceae bacterium]
MTEMSTFPDGLRYRHWSVDGAPQAVVIVVHGLGEHSGRYEALAAEMNARGFAVLAPDHIGHGESPGPRVFVRHFDDYLPGVRQCRDFAEQQYAGAPCFILGHSMGGLITARLLLDDADHYRGALFSGPAFAVTEPPNILLMGVARLLARVAPTLGMMALDASGVSRDPKVVADYNADPLVNHGKVTAGLAVAIFAAMDQVMSRASEIALPVLVMHGGDDTMAAPEGAQAFASKIASTDNTLKILPGLYHEIFNEPEGPDIIAEYADWIEARL